MSDQSQTRYNEAQSSAPFADERGAAVASMQPIDLVSPELGGMGTLDAPRRGAEQASRPGNGGDALVFIAMGLVSSALGLGLYAHVGIDLPVALIAALGLFVSTSFLHVFVRRMQGVDLLDRRVTALEDKVSHIDSGSIAGPAAVAAPTQGELDTMPQGDIAISHESAPEPAPRDTPREWVAEPIAPAKQEVSDLPPAYQIPSDAAAGFAPERSASSIADPIFDLANPANASVAMDGRGGVSAEVDEKPFEHAKDLAAPQNSEDHRSIDGLVRQLSQGMSSQTATDSGDAKSQSRLSAGALQNEQRHTARIEAPAASDAGAASAAIPVFGQRDPSVNARRESGETPLIAMPPKPISAETEFGMPIASSLNLPEEPVADPIGQAIQDAIKHGNVEIYLQPILSIDDRKVRFFEVLGRVKGVGGDVIATEDHAELTRSIRASIKLDRAIMTRAARLLRKLTERRQAQPLICNISRETLSSSTFAHEFVEFMGGYRDIAPFMIFEVDHTAISAADTTTLGNLRALASMGFRLSFDNVANVEQALANGRELDVSFIKLSYETLLPAQQNQADARARAATIQSVARDSGMTLVVDRIERKDQLAGVTNAGINLGQGYLFSEPKPLLPQVAAEVAEDSAAA